MYFSKCAEPFDVDSVSDVLGPFTFFDYSLLECNINVFLFIPSVYGIFYK